MKEAENTPTDPERKNIPNKVYLIKCRTCESNNKNYVLANSAKGLDASAVRRITARHSRAFLEQHIYQYQ